MLTKCSESNLHKLSLDFGCGLRKALRNNQFLPLAIIWLSFIPKQTESAVLDFIDRPQRGYTVVQHQLQIIVVHSDTSGNSDAATSHWLKSGSFCKHVETCLF